MAHVNFCYNEEGIIKNTVVIKTLVFISFDISTQFSQIKQKLINLFIKLFLIVLFYFCTEAIYYLVLILYFVPRPLFLFIHRTFSGEDQRAAAASEEVKRTETARSEAQ